jgi:hypothetical protein
MSTELILICAATAVEARAVRRVATAPHFEVLQTGMGPARATRALTKRLKSAALPAPSLVISTGFAGIELPDVPLGSWALGTEVTDTAGKSPFTLHWRELEARLARAKLTVSHVPFRLADEVVQISQDSQGASNTHAIDMESHALAKVAHEHGIPLAVLRLISDTPDAPLPRAIGAFSQVSTAVGITRKAGGALAGLGHTLARPRELGRFLARGSKLSKQLEDDWSALIATW